MNMLQSKTPASSITITYTNTFGFNKNPLSANFLLVNGYMGFSILFTAAILQKGQISHGSHFVNVATTTCYHYLPPAQKCYVILD